MKKRILMVTMLFTSMFLLAGWGSKTVELFDKERLIDLDKAIKSADLGKEGSEITSKKENENLEQESINEMEEEVREVKNTFQIIVQNKTIKFEDKECKDVEELKSFLIQNCPKGSELCIEDDYAESHVYAEVLDAIKEIQKEMEWAIIYEN